MSRKLRKRTLAVLAGGVLVSGPVFAACSSGPTYDQWAATDGAAGRINLDAVQEAYKESKSATEFEKRVNRIYEGDGIVLIRASQDGSRQMVEAFEDLNGDGADRRLRPTTSCSASPRTTGRTRSGATARTATTTTASAAAAFCSATCWRPPSARLTTTTPRAAL